VKSLGQYVDEAIPHEAGHILVGRAVGFLARGLDAEVVRFPDRRGISVGNFATLAYSPPDDAIPNMDSELRASYVLFVAGGVAGNKFDGLVTACQGADEDRKELARLTGKSLEEVAELAVAIIHKHRRHFRQLVSLIRLRCIERIMRNSDVQTGRVSLLSQEDIQGILEASK